MPHQMDIADEEELEEEGEEEGESPEDAKAKQQQQQQQQQRENAETRAQLTQLQQLVQKLNDKTEAGDKVTQKDVSAVEKMTAALISEGYKPESLKGTLAMLDAFKEDLEKNIEAKYARAKEEENKKSIAEKSLDRMQDELNKILASTPELLGDPEFNEMVLKKMWGLMSKAPEFENTRKAYDAGRPPSIEDIQKSARMVLQKLPGGFAMVGSDNKNEGLDARNSRPKGSHPAIGKKGEVDVDKLNDFERDIYTTTLNTTKNKELALEALKELGHQKLW